MYIPAAERKLCNNMLSILLNWLQFRSFILFRSDKADSKRTTWYLDMGTLVVAVMSSCCCCGADPDRDR